MRFVLLDMIAATLAAAHFADYVVRGNIVVTHGLDPNSCWAGSEDRYEGSYGPDIG